MRLFKQSLAGTHINSLKIQRLIAYYKQFVFANFWLTNYVLTNYQSPNLLTYHMSNFVTF